MKYWVKDKIKIVPKFIKNLILNKYHIKLLVTNKHTIIVMKQLLKFIIHPNFYRYTKTAIYFQVQQLI